MNGGTQQISGLQYSPFDISGRTLIRDSLADIGPWTRPA